jgi:hypothetical protein
MNVDLKKLLAKPYLEQRRYVAKTLGQKNSCILFNAAMRNKHGHSVDDEPLLRQLRHLVDIETAVDYHNRSEVVTQRILTRSDSDVVWSEIYNQYIPAIAVQATAGNPTAAWTLIMAMLAKVESQY